MTQPLQSDRRRLIEALGLGPVWTQRTTAEAVDAATLDWATLQRMVSSGGACGLVGDSAADGTMRSEWLVIGASTTGDADAFAGRAGRLLDAMLAAIGLGRDRTVFVASLLNAPARTTGSRILERQIELLAPRIILVVGDIAAKVLLPDAPEVRDLRGKTRGMTVAGRHIDVVATFHPSQLLEDGAAKAQAWDDLCLARQVFDERSAAAIA